MGSSLFAPVQKNHGCFAIGALAIITLIASVQLARWIAPPHSGHCTTDIQEAFGSELSIDDGKGTVRPVAVPNIAVATE